MIKPVANKEEKNDRAESKAAINGNQVPSKDITAAGTHGVGLSGSGRQQRRVGLALIAVSLLTIVAAGAWLGPDPATGITQWIARGFIQSVYGALLALFLWTVVWRRRAISYLLLFGVTCICIAAWDTGAGIYANRVRLEANNMLITFRDTPLNVQDLAGTIERNPYVEAYMIMRDAQWELHNRLDQRMADYGASYRTYVENGAFLDIGRLQSTLEPYRALYGRRLAVDRQSSECRCRDTRGLYPGPARRSRGSERVANRTDNRGTAYVGADQTVAAGADRRQGSL
jgi:hypothetical protein